MADILGYEWEGYGMTLFFQNGTVWLQGDDACDLYDELEACKTREQLALVMGEYEQFAEDYE